MTYRRSVAIEVAAGAGVGAWAAASASARRSHEPVDSVAEASVPALSSPQHAAGGGVMLPYMAIVWISYYLTQPPRFGLICGSSSAQNRMYQKFLVCRSACTLLQDPAVGGRGCQINESILSIISFFFCKLIKIICIYIYIMMHQCMHTTREYS